MVQLNRKAMSTYLNKIPFIKKASNVADDL
jgi:hypothetical protein